MLGSQKVRPNIVKTQSQDMVKIRTEWRLISTQSGFGAKIWSLVMLTTANFFV
jgi:hypothetical protein